MKVFKEIAGRICAIWAALMFVITMLLFLIPFFIFVYPLPDPKKSRRFIKFAQVWMGVYLPLIGCPLRVRGRKHFAPGQTYVVVCNHNSLMDVPISSPAIPGGNKTIAKIEMAKIPLFGLIYQTGSVLVDRKRESSRKESFLKMRKVLDMGLHMCIYPEGTRNLTDQPIKAFHSGAFRLAIDTGKAIIPGVIFHTAKVLPAHKPFFLLPHSLRIDFLPPVPVTPGENAELLKDKVHEMMRKHYEQVSGE